MKILLSKANAFFDIRPYIEYFLFVIYVLTGPVRFGKTSFLKRFLSELSHRGCRIDGFLSVAYWEGQKHCGYDLFDLRERKTIPFIRLRGNVKWPKVGPFFFIPQALQEAKSIILRAKNVNLLVADEIGPLEMAGKGVWPALKEMIFLTSPSMLCVVRSGLLENFQLLLDKRTACIFDIKEKDIFSRMIGTICA